MNKIKLIVLILIILFGSGCVNKDTSENNILPTTITPTLTTAATHPSPLYEIYSGYDYRPTAVYELYSNKMDKAFIRIEAVAMGEGSEYYNKESGKMEREFQVWNKPDSNYNIDVLYITVPIEKINGTIQPESEVLIYGYFDNNIWFEGTNKYGTSIRQPWIFAHNVTVIPEIQLQRWVWEGKGNFKTPIFHINTSEWVIIWSDELSDLPGGFNFEIIVYDSSNRIVKTIKGYREGIDSGTQAVKGPGEFYLEIKTGMKYNVSVRE